MEGELYADETGRATDLELAGGEREVLGAGRWVVEQGHVLVVTNESPTYRPSLAQMRAAVACLARMGADLTGDGKGLLVIVYAEIDKDGRGTHGKRYRATKSADGVELIPESIPVVNVEDWDDVSPEDLMSNPGLFSGKPIVEAAARARNFGRSGDSNRYDEIGFRSSAATPAKGPVPLQTIAGARFEKESEQRKQLTPELEELLKQQRKLRHRPLQLPSGGHFRYQVTGNNIDFVLVPDSGDDSAEDIWSFPLTAPPPMLLEQGVEERDLPQLLTQHVRVDIPCSYWLPATALIEAGQFKRLQDWGDRLSTKTERGCFYGFVSHRWLSTTHPDPDGVHARFLSWQLFAHLCEAVRVALRRGLETPRTFSTLLGFPIGFHGSDLAESLLVNILRPTLDSKLLKEAANEIATIESVLDDFGLAAANNRTALQELREALQPRPLLSKLMSRIHIWYDFSCMPQAPRTDSEEAEFRKGLESLNDIQVLGRTLVLLDDVEDYLSRAWCTLEAIVSDTQLQSIDLLIGSQRATARAGRIEHFFRNLMEDRPHIVWRALLDTELFRLQSSNDCMARLGLKTTDATDLPYIYESLRKLRAPAKIHVDSSELVTGAFPLPVVDQGTSVLWARHSGRSVAKQDETHQQSLDWTDVLRLETGWNRKDSQDAAKVLPSMQIGSDTNGHLSKKECSRCHVAVIGSCEGEAVMLSNWVREHRGDLESLIDASIVSLTWLSTDIAPVGHFVYGDLSAVAIDVDAWVVVAFSTRFGNCSLTGFLVELLTNAGERIFTFSVDDRTDNVLMLPSASNSAVNDTESKQFIHIKLPDEGFPVIPGGLFREAVVDHLVPFDS